ncbi:MAG: hypothetical protein PQJ50_18655 [Spirochaetales bacterium]|nr:hypothetical protein [Spirochaetales bacterium]
MEIMDSMKLKIFLGVRKSMKTKLSFGFILFILWSFPLVYCQDTETSRLPIVIEKDDYFTKRIGYNICMWKGQIWLYGGNINPWSGKSKYVTDIWNSQDGIHFKKVVEDDQNYDIPWGVSSTQYSICDFNDELIAIGERLDENDLKRSKDFISWIPIDGDFPFVKRNESDLIIFKDRLWMFGGIGERDAWVTNDVLNWQSVHSPLKEAYSNYDAIAFQDQMIILGSEEGLYITSDGETWVDIELDPGIKTSLIGNYPESYRKGFDLVEYNGYLYLLGGGCWNSPGHNAYFDPIEELEGSYNDVWRSTNGRDWEQIARVRDDLPQEKETAIRYYVEHDPNPDDLEYWELIDKYSQYSFSKEEILTAYQAQYRAIYDTYSPASEFHAVVFNDKIYLYNYYEIWTTEDGSNWTLLAFLEDKRSNYEGYIGSPETQALKMAALKAKYGDRWDEVRLEGMP